MTWFKIDDGFADHPKVIRLQTMEGWQGALALWALAGAWASRHLTDGEVPKAIVARLGCQQADADLLVAAGLWERTPDGYAYHDWIGCNPSKADVETRREKTRVRVADWRHNKARESPPHEGTDETSNGVTFDVTPGVTQRVTYASRNASPVPSRSDPRITLPSVANSPRGRARGVCDALSDGADPGPSAGEIQTRFRKLFLERHGVEPYLGGGEAVRTFADRLRSTAQEKKVDALELLRETFERWSAKPLDEISQNAPYASFAGRFGSLCGVNGSNGSGPYGGGGSALERLQTAQIDALEAGDRERYCSLVDEERRMRGSKV